jgi:hypothetical protein
MANDFTKRWAVLDRESLCGSKRRGLAALAPAEVSVTNSLRDGTVPKHCTRYTA